MNWERILGAEAAKLPIANQEYGQITDTNSK